MKIFISHSSLDSNFGNAIVDLLISVGISGKDIIYTSNPAYGIPTGKNIFNWLKEQISERPFVIYLLSPNYYKSIACLNEMGASWVIESNHVMIFTPNFDLNSYEFRNGAIDPREIGFIINDEDRIYTFIETLKGLFDISGNSLQINQAIRKYLASMTKVISEISNTGTLPPFKASIKADVEKPASSTLNLPPLNKMNSTPHFKFLQDLKNDKLKDEEILLIKYISETDKFKLGTGWRESYEQNDIRIWEDINGLDDTLSSNYPGLITRLQIKKLLVTTDSTSHGNPKEISFVDAMNEIILNQSEELKAKIEFVQTNHLSEF